MNFSASTAISSTTITRTRTPDSWSIGPGTALLFSRWMFEPRHNILSNVRTDIGKNVVSWLEHSRESNRPVPGPLLQELSILSVLACRWWLKNFPPFFTIRLLWFWQSKIDVSNLLFPPRNAHAQYVRGAGRKWKRRHPHGTAGVGWSYNDELPVLQYNSDISDLRVLRNLSDIYEIRCVRGNFYHFVVRGQKILFDISDYPI